MSVGRGRRRRRHPKSKFQHQPEQPKTRVSRASCARSRLLPVWSDRLVGYRQSASRCSVIPLQLASPHPWVQRRAREPQTQPGQPSFMTAHTPLARWLGNRRPRRTGALPGPNFHTPQGPCVSSGRSHSGRRSLTTAAPDRARRLQEALGETVVVDNRRGAAGCMIAHPLRGRYVRPRARARPPATRLLIGAFVPGVNRRL